VTFSSNTARLWNKLLPSPTTLFIENAPIFDKKLEIKL
jgi:hypothetical protein